MLLDLLVHDFEESLLMTLGRRPEIDILMALGRYKNANNWQDIDMHARLVVALEFPDPGVVERLQEELEVTREEAEQMWLDAKLFLWACAHSESMCPTKAIDEAWHTFILFTREYFKFCNLVNGRYIHHKPHVGDAKPSEEESKLLFEDTKTAIERLFNVENLSDNWSLYTMAACGCQKCGRNCCRDCCAVAPSNEAVNFAASCGSETKPIISKKAQAKSPAMARLHGAGDCSFSPACQCGKDNCSSGK